MKKQKILLIAALLTTGLTTGRAWALNLCPSTVPIPQVNAVKFFYDVPFPQQVGTLAGNLLELNHNGTAPLVGGLIKKSTVYGASPSCTAQNQMQQDAVSGQWYCPGYLEVQAKAEPGLTSLTLYFVESINVTQTNVANTFTDFPHCALGGVVPCQPGDANALAWQPIIDSIFPHKKLLHAINIKAFVQAVTLTDTSTPGYIKTNINAPNHQEYLQLHTFQNSYPNWANQNPKFFTFGQQFGVSGGPCFTVSQQLPVQHNP